MRMLTSICWTLSRPNHGLTAAPWQIEITHVMKRLSSVLACIPIVLGIAGLAGDVVVVADEFTRVRSRGDGVYRVRSDDRLILREGEPIYRSAGGFEFVICDKRQLAHEGARLVDAGSNHEQTCVALLLFATGAGQDLIASNMGRARMLSSARIPEKVIFSRILSVSKTGRFVLLDVGRYREEGKGEFSVVYEPAVVDMEEERYLASKGVDEWADFRGK